MIFIVVYEMVLNEKEEIWNNKEVCNNTLIDLRYFDSYQKYLRLNHKYQKIFNKINVKMS